MIDVLTTEKCITPSQKSLKKGFERWRHYYSGGLKLWYEYKHTDGRMYCISIPDVGINSIEFARHLRDEHFQDNINAITCLRKFD